jgi:hypothetical protein
MEPRGFRLGAVRNDTDTERCGRILLSSLVRTYRTGLSSKVLAKDK